MNDNHDVREANASPVTASRTKDMQSREERSGKVDRRAERIEEYLRDSLEMEDPLQANIGAGTSDLMHIRSKLAESLMAELEAGYVTLDEYRKQFAPVVSSLLLLDRYIVAYSRLSHDLKRAESPERNAPRRRQQPTARGETC